MYSIRRKIISGDKRGRNLGFPTLNLRYYRNDKIRFGVWLVVLEIGNKKFKGLAHIGPSPTFKIKKPRIEIYLFNFSKNLYNRSVKVEFLKYLRPTKKFKTKRELILQIKKDCQRAREYNRI